MIQRAILTLAIASTVACGASAGPQCLSDYQKEPTSVETPNAAPNGYQKEPTSVETPNAAPNGQTGVADPCAPNAATDPNKH